MSDRDAPVGPINVSVDPGADLQLEHVLLRIERPDAGERRIEVLDNGLGATSRISRNESSRVSAMPMSAPNAARRDLSTSASSACLRGVISRRKASIRPPALGQ